jgi:hypothetical protein
MDKQVTGTVHKKEQPIDSWLDLAAIANVEVSSEEPEHPIEAALIEGYKGIGWKAASTGDQSIRLIFKEPQNITRISILFKEKWIERTQKFILSWLPAGEQLFKEILIQEWNFNPSGSIEEIEDYKVDLKNVAALELYIVPDIKNESVIASLSQLRLA